MTVAATSVGVERAREAHAERVEARRVACRFLGVLAGERLGLHEQRALEGLTAELRHGGEEVGVRGRDLVLVREEEVEGAGRLAAHPQRKGVDRLGLGPERLRARGKPLAQLVIGARGGGLARAVRGRHAEVLCDRDAGEQPRFRARKVAPGDQLERQPVLAAEHERAAVRAEMVERLVEEGAADLARIRGARERRREPVQALRTTLGEGERRLAPPRTQGPVAQRRRCGSGTDRDARGHGDDGGCAHA